MPTRTLNANKSSLFADAGSTELGGGNDDHMPVGGPWGGYTFRSAVRFALDWSGVKSITSATLRLRTSTRVHVDFSGAPDFYVARITSDWTANSGKSSADSGGGPGWSTSPTVYPGPSATSSGQVSKRASTAESTWVEVDITAIVKAWAPAAIGGGAAPNYGVRLMGVASGDITEFSSSKSTYNPEITLVYTTDRPPVAVMDGPTGAVGTVRPTLTGSASDPDGDAITSYYVEVLSGATLVYSATLPGAPTFAHVPTADLPGGALTARATAGAGGLSSAAWSNSVAFTVDRPPVVGYWASPPATTSERRPALVWEYADPDGNVGDLYDVEVYATSAGAPSGAPVWAMYDSTVGLTATYVSVAPTADLPGGNLVVRSRIRSGPASLWSAWSGYHPFLIALNAPSVAWVYPTTDGGYVPNANLSDLAIVAVKDVLFFWQWDVRPPSGQTLTNVKVEFRYSDTGWFTHFNGAPQPGPAGGLHTEYRLASSGAGTVPYGSGRIRMTATASGGGVTTVERAWKASAGEWFGTIGLGDNVTALAATLTPKATYAVGWLRAQSASAATGPWRPLSEAATVRAELPAMAAYLGLRTRHDQRLADADLITNGGFEQGLTGWYAQLGGTLFNEPAPGNQPDGSAHRGNLYVETGTTGTYPSAYSIDYPVVPGASYRVSGWVSASGASRDRALRLEYRDAAGTIKVGAEAYVSSNAWQFVSFDYIMPADAVTAMIRYFMYQASVPARDCYALFDTVSLVGPVPGASGLDRFVIDWTSAG